MVRSLRGVSFAFLFFHGSNAVPELRVGGSPGPRGQTALELWASWVNDNSEAAGHTVALDFSDYDVATYEATITNSMANWDIVIPPYGSSQSDTVVTLVDGAKPILVWGGATESIFEHEGVAGQKVFGTFTPASHYFDSGLQVAFDGGAATAVFVENESPFSNACCAGAQAKALALGMTSSGILTYDRTADDAALETLAADVAATEADVVVNCGHEDDTIRVVLQLGAVPFCPKALIATNSLLNVDTHYTGDNAGLPQGIMMPTQWSTLAPSVVDPITGWSRADVLTALGSGATYHAASAVLAGLSITAAMQTLSGDTFVETDFLTAMRGLDVTTVVGRVKFSAVSPVGANTLKPMMTEQLQVESEIVAPCTSKTKDAEYPRQCAAGVASTDVLTPCGEVSTPDEDSAAGDDSEADQDAHVSATHMFRIVPVLAVFCCAFPFGGFL